MKFISVELFTQLHHFAQCPRRAAQYSQMLYFNIHCFQRCWLLAFHSDLIYTQQQGSSLYKIKIHVSSRQMEMLPAHKLRAKQAEFSHILTTTIFSSINLSSSVMFESLSAQTNTSVLEININIKKTSLKLRRSTHCKKCWHHFMERVQEMPGSHI